MSLQEKVNEVIQCLIGCPLNEFGRAANLFWFIFTNITLHNPKENKSQIASEYSLHIQCQWRIRKGTQVLIGHRDLRTPKDYPENLDIEDFDYDEIGSSRFDMLCEEFQDIFSQLKVDSANANELGELTIFFEKDYILETFIDSSLDTENWRLFLRNREDLPHWVQEGDQLTGE